MTVVMNMNIPSKKGIVVICLLAALQSLARIVIPLVIITDDGSALETPVSDEVMLFISLMFYALGVLGLLTAFGMWTGKRWGFIGTLVLSAVTIVFDIWAVLAVQSSAAMGLVLPIVFIIYLAMMRQDIPKK
ncbi:MAG: hypothetical protein LUQ09_02210 [Methanomassiliicoccales archaeon]|nr:hypothetical protein [Methanomassiliicoccales archaeon]